MPPPKTPSSQWRLPAPVCTTYVTVARLESYRKRIMLLKKLRRKKTQKKFLRRRIKRIKTKSKQLKKTKFDWDEVITSLLMKKDDKEMKLNKLKKKCLSEFFSSNEGTHKTQEGVGAKFDKKLKKRKYRLLKDRVKLIVDDEPEEKIISEKPEPVIKKETKPAMSFNQW